MTAGLNMGAESGPGPIELSSQQFSIPPASSVVGGTSVSGSLVDMRPLRGFIVAGLTIAGLTMTEPSAQVTQQWPTIEISVSPAARIIYGQPSSSDLRAAYEELRRAMVSEGLGFLDAAELEREIAERKGEQS